MADFNISYKVKGDFKKTNSYLEGLRFFIQRDLFNFDYYGQRGVDALAAATPVDTGLTANSWYYEVEKTLIITLFAFPGTTQMLSMDGVR